MRLLLDQGLPRSAAIETVHVSEIGYSAADDATILEKGREEFPRSPCSFTGRNSIGDSYSYRGIVRERSSRSYTGSSFTLYRRLEAGSSSDSAVEPNTSSPPTLALVKTERMRDKLYAILGNKSVGLSRMKLSANAQHEYTMRRAVKIPSSNESKAGSCHGGLQPGEVLRAGRFIFCGAPTAAGWGGGRHENCGKSEIAGQ